MSMLELTDWTKTTRVKAQIKEVEKKCGVEAEPSTQTTRRLISIMLASTIKEVCAKTTNERLNEVLEHRTEVLLVLELLAGLRVGEATSSGDLHGLEANSVCFLKPLGRASNDGLGETIEVAIRDSKTGPGRHAAFVAKTQGDLGLEGGKIMRQWIRTAGLGKMQVSVEGGFERESPNYWVARVNLASMNKMQLATFLYKVEQTLCEAFIGQYSAIAKYAKERHGSKTLGEDMCYVNVMGGQRFKEIVGNNGGFMRYVYDPKLQMAIDWLEGEGYGYALTVVPGPFVRATLGKTLTHMPLATASTYTHLLGATKAAYEISKMMKEPDMELDLQGAEKPKFGNHSFRRHSDKVARESLPLHEARGVINVVTKQLIDYFYGWLLKEMNKDMQLHYAGLDRPSRRCLARVSMFF